MPFQNLGLVMPLNAPPKKQNILDLVSDILSSTCSVKLVYHTGLPLSEDLALETSFLILLPIICHIFFKKCNSMDILARVNMYLSDEM